MHQFKKYDTSYAQDKHKTLLVLLENKITEKSVCKTGEYT